MKWAVTERGRSIPLDPDPVLDGNIELVNGVAVVLGGLELHQAHATNTVLHKSHFATCASPFNPSNRRKHDARPTSNEG
jgi:hypothetical protein